VSSIAERTLELGRGDCVALATVMVGLGRGLGWPIYFAEARTKEPETHEFAELTVLSDHMVVIIVAKTVQMVVDFLGLVDDEYDIHPIDDLTAYAHLINNVAGHRVISGEEGATQEAWLVALDGFKLATRIQPELGRAWNNLGIAYTRLGRFDEARVAYHQAVELDTAFGSPKHNLTIMETRASGAPTLTQSKRPR
jgi:tetratricopeptide (TPR) repeat protein